MFTIESLKTTYNSYKNIIDSVLAAIIAAIFIALSYSYIHNKLIHLVDERIKEQNLDAQIVVTAMVNKLADGISDVEQAKAQANLAKLDAEKALTNSKKAQAYANNSSDIIKTAVDGKIDSDLIISKSVEAVNNILSSNKLLKLDRQCFAPRKVQRCHVTWGSGHSADSFLIITGEDRHNKACPPGYKTESKFDEIILVGVEC
ncbi:hypothetical protein N473_01265 [Pseudoalteromonas luteoviolacea CPMOR-1]|uniref:Uncharacterized protein n=1 Tax=Pseudoalteromonas luteoviolacea CPMOR-1 TaxID=1365248 RepID=A0A161Z918_9GAMM|nr:hypothetical protein [Pseudoalteromonas luteoviolacea]KZN65231.1 hypothetical protein N473_01265 [Pseudoalteromonas luteoviolacea CPMOR-1]